MSSELDEIQQLARLFLAAFVLIGVYPFLRKRIDHFIDYLLALRRSPERDLMTQIYDSQSPDTDFSRMDGLDFLVFEQLSQFMDRGATSRELARRLYLDRLLVMKILLTLNKKGLVSVQRKRGFNSRFLLSDKGKMLAGTRGIHSIPVEGRQRIK